MIFKENNKREIDERSDEKEYLLQVNRLSISSPNSLRFNFAHMQDEEDGDMLDLR